MIIESDYPQKVDELIFYSDMPIDRAAAAGLFLGQLHAGNYTAASKILREQTDHYYGAGLFNLLENRLEKLQMYLKSKPKINPHQYSNTKPSHMKTGDIWIGEGE